MTKEVFDDIFAHLDKSNKDLGKSIIVSQDILLPIHPSFFHKDLVQASEKIAFVDGGNGELFSAPNFSLQFIRVYGSIFEENKITKRELKEFYVTVTANKKDGKIVYQTKTFDSDFSINLDFDLHDSTLSSSTHSVAPSAVAECVRKFAEIKMAIKMCEHLQKNDLLVRDGELFARATFEQEYFDKLFSQAKDKGILLCGFSKTTSLLTDSGNSASAVLNLLGETPPWHYFPEQNSEIKVCFTKLAKHSNYVFRADFYNIVSVQKAVSLLFKNSQDPSFLGYPYGLVEADLRARVSKQECSNLRIHFLTKFNEPFKEHRSSIDAHDVLNLIN